MAGGFLGPQTPAAEMTAREAAYCEILAALAAHYGCLGPDHAAELAEKAAMLTDAGLARLNGAKPREGE